MAERAVTSSAASWAPPPETIIRLFAAPRSFAALRTPFSSRFGRGAAAGGDHRAFRGPEELRGLADRVLVELWPGSRQRRLRRDHAGLAPDVDGALQRRRARTAGRHRAERLGHPPGRLLGFADQR